jgi:hypothetical protein
MNHVCSAAATDQDTQSMFVSTAAADQETLKACLFLQLQLIMKHSVEILTDGISLQQTCANP